MKTAHKLIPALLLAAGATTLSLQLWNETQASQRQEGAMEERVGQCFTIIRLEGQVCGLALPECTTAIEGITDLERPSLTRMLVQVDPGWDVDIPSVVWNSCDPGEYKKCRRWNIFGYEGIGFLDWRPTGLFEKKPPRYRHDVLTVPCPFTR